MMMDAHDKVRKGEREGGRERGRRRRRSRGIDEFSQPKLQITVTIATSSMSINNTPKPTV
jgi:hypothetical protein